ncbi:unnamed protein product [Clonostachys rhizophaga]|uniref:Nucleoside phosphorylase domain-containing protein n=1 Tax=Clonostachys rhizophaga TaxID=160324 RepID=A0A9N9VXA0_9HYPO|nr:unnamed protein product [Clonostachys rhizophaga]
MEDFGYPKTHWAIGHGEQKGDRTPNEKTSTPVVINHGTRTTSEREPIISDQSYSRITGRVIRNVGYTCQYCAKTFTRVEHLRRHMLTHTADPSFVCDLCQKPFWRKDLMERHIERHTMERHTMERYIEFRDKRVSHACLSCVKARVKCDGNKPCKRCISIKVDCMPAPLPLTVAAHSVDLAGKSLSATPNVVGDHDLDHDLGLDGEKSLAREYDIPDHSGYGSIAYGMIQEPNRTVSGANAALNSQDVQLQPRLDQLVDGDRMPSMSECNDLLTCHSDETAIPAQRIEDYALDFAEELFKTIMECDLDQSRLQGSFSTISNLLRDFSIKIGCEGTPQVYRDVMFFTHKYRGHICKCLYHLCSKSDWSESRHEDFTSEKMPLRERLGSWFEGLPGDTSEYLHFRDLKIVDDIDNSDVSSTSEPGWLDEAKETNKEVYTGFFREFVLNSSACRWLLPRLQLEIACAQGQSQAMHNIKRTITSRLKEGLKISKRMCQPSRSVLFIMQWDLKGFLQEQELGICSHEAIANIITLTGADDLIQALTTKEYMKQTWPLTGLQVLGVVQDAYKTGLKSSVTLYDGTEINALFRQTLFEDQELVVSANGSSPSLAEVGEQLAWLAAALRSAPNRDWKQDVYCTPFIYNEEMPSDSVICKIGFDFQNIDKRSYPANGHCWHKLFTSPIVVGGYPIPSRPEACKGVEIPLNIMALLAGTNQINIFNGKTVIKGFSTLIYPTKKTADTIYWHLTGTNNEDRISYLSETPGHVGFIEKRELESRRCVLGWCSDAEFYAGSAYANYLIESAYLGTPDAGCPLADLTLVPSIPVADCSAFVCKRDSDVSLQLGRKGYIKRLKWLDKKFVLLWDEGDRRGWLMKGTTALLHLVRSSLQYDSVDKFRSEFLFRKEDLEEAELVDPQAAVKVLLSKRNRALKLYEEEDESFKDRVDHCFGILERLIDYQEDAGERGSRDSKEQARQYLSGWDFHELATKNDTRLFSRMTILESPGKSWVDFIKSIQAITLFGRGFGTLIKPSTSTTICNNWREVPKDRFYISAATSDLKDITNVSYTKDGHTRIGLHNIWHTETTAFDYTPCSLLRGHDCHEPVQSLLPLSMSSAVSPGGKKLMLSDSGAVIFGHHSKLGWVWDDFGPPRQGDLHPYDSTLVDSPLPTDSGYVSSQKSSIQEFDSKFSLPPLNGAMNTAVAESPAPVEQYPREVYTVGILCALDIELLAIRALLDETHDDTDRATGDDYAYALGRMGKHKVVATCLPDGEYGTNPAAECATNMKRSFSNIRFCLLVGIGGGVPSDANDIRLGDVVVSLPKGDLPGVIQYDRGKENGDAMLERTGALQGPPRALRALINYLKSTPGGSSDMLLTYVENIIASESVGSKKRFSHPGEELDILFESRPEGDNNSQPSHQVKHREPRPTNSPVVHYGTIASGNKVIKNARFRDEWGQKYGVLCFEMEAAGVMNILPTLVIRGICDYCDAQKNKVWQEYAAATAAAYTRHLLFHLPYHEPDNRILWKRMNSDLFDAQTEERPKKFTKIP